MTVAQTIRTWLEKSRKHTALGITQICLCFRASPAHETLGTALGKQDCSVLQPRAKSTNTSRPGVCSTSKGIPGSQPCWLDAAATTAGQSSHKYHRKRSVRASSSSGCLGQSEQQLPGPGTGTEHPEWRKRAELFTFILILSKFVFQMRKQSEEFQLPQSLWSK